MQMSYLHASDFPFKNFCKIVQHTEKYRKNTKKYRKNTKTMFGKRVILVVDRSTDHEESYFDFYVFMFLRRYQRQRKCFLSERELKKGIARHIDASSVVGTSNFSLVRSEHAHASYPGLTSWTLLSPARVQPLYGVGRKESSGTVSDICRLQTADCRLQTADCRLQTADHRPQTSGYRLHTMDLRP